MKQYHYTAIMQLSLIIGAIVLLCFDKVGGAFVLLAILLFCDWDSTSEK